MPQFMTHVVFKAVTETVSELRVSCAHPLDHVKSIRRQPSAPTAADAPHWLHVDARHGHYRNLLSGFHCVAHLQTALRQADTRQWMGPLKQWQQERGIGTSRPAKSLKPGLVECIAVCTVPPLVRTMLRACPTTMVAAPRHLRWPAWPSAAQLLVLRLRQPVEAVTLTNQQPRSPVVLLPAHSQDALL